MATLSPSIFAELVPQRQDVEQPLGRVLVLPVAGVDDVRADPLRPGTSAEPEAWWRITTMSMCIASRFRAVSTRVSPLLTEDPELATFTVSAESRFSANSKEMRVRVEASKKRLTIVLPAERRHLLDRPLADFLERLGGVEDEPDLVGREVLERR